MPPKSGIEPDTIAALATPPGIGALAVVRISGPDAFAILESLASHSGPDDGGSPALPEPRRATLRDIRDPETEELLDRALVTVFPGPGSYTGEDVVEISGHGGFLSARLLVEACLRSGAREAEPGEFTRRAYLNGRMDLVQAEAVIDLVEGRNRGIRRAALHQLDRGLSTRISELREELVELEALLTHHLDFPDEDEPPVSVERVIERSKAVCQSLRSLAETAPEGELLREGATTVLAGRPNSGKSSLFNALLGRERAIVTEVAGTTRDALEAVASVGGFPFRLVDTAGLRESGDRIERIGIEVARRYLREADVVLFCVEAGRELQSDEEEFLRETRGVPGVLVRTKADRLEGGAAEAEEEGTEPGETGVRWPSVRTSAHSGEGLARLRKLLPGIVYRGLASVEGEVPVVTRARQARGIRHGLTEVEAFARALEEGVPAEMAATHLRSAETALEEVLGVISGDDVLDRVFRDFCIGK
ncbi:MAG: tRNA uridine-5-carboxymethylaminomethyl(34) synthesis GTPase MnmE [Longimicrobiales bacterium]|nr:tRNA uridine-5-carboxymethylaminomethyl(34) synthesis GTPase MnmE [Longimicrobiales bacterium]